MSQYVLEPELNEYEQEVPRRRRQHAIDERLVLSELNPDAVIDQLEAGDGAIELITFGTVRETCPKCRQPHLKLVLRQRRVRLAHLLCTECLSCYDAHYVNGASALTI